MIYRFYTSYGNTLGIDEFLSYSELAEDGYWSRYLEIRPDGTAVRYTTQRDADEFGILPEKTWDEEEAAKPGYGIMAPISAALFEAVWSNTRCLNN